MPDRLLIRASAPDGSPALPDELYVADLDGKPQWSERRAIGPGVIALAYPKVTPFVICALWEIPGFGKVLATADNKGEGYLPDNREVGLTAELARTRLRRVEERVAAEARRGVGLPAGTIDRLGQARSALEGGVAGEYVSLREAMWAGEEVELAAAAHNIAGYSSERRRALRFGSPYMALDVTEKFNARFAELYDFATLPFYRARFEPREGAVDWATRDQLLAWVRSQGITPKGHPLYWSRESGMPDWMMRLSYSTLKEVVYRQVFETVSRYKDAIKIWDVINEANDSANVQHLRREQLLELTAIAARATRDADPDAVRIVNCDVPWGENAARNERPDRMDAYQYFRLAIDQGIDFEVVGLQLYHGAATRWVRDMAEQAALLDRFARLGKPIHITEVQTPSATELDLLAYARSWDPSRPGYWHRPWDPEVQADWVEQFYTVAVGKSYVDAVSWWSMSDRGTFFPHGGVLDRNDEPKPSFHRLKALIAGIRGEARGEGSDQ